MEATNEPQYAAYITAYNNFMQPALKQIIDIFNPPPGSKGLDAGCGTGDFFDLLAVVKEFERITRSGGRIAIFWKGWQRH